MLDRYRENRSQFVVTMLKGVRGGIFWQTAKTTRKTRKKLGELAGNVVDGSLLVTLGEL